MTDGNYWIFEHRSSKKYKGHSTRKPDSLLAVCGLYLLELTGEVYEKEDCACLYSRNRIYLNKNNEIITKNEVIDSLISHVNLYLKNNKFKSHCCEIPDYFITISSKGKFKRVSSIYGEGLFLDFLYFFEDRKCRRAYRKILKGFDFPGLNLKSNIMIYFECSYDKKRNVLYRKK